jgi:hypothetical protein
MLIRKFCEKFLDPYPSPPRYAEIRGSVSTWIISFGNEGRFHMRTFILAWVIGLLGLIMIAGGIWGIIDLFRQEVRAPLKSYGGQLA